MKFFYFLLLIVILPVFGNDNVVNLLDKSETTGNVFEKKLLSNSNAANSLQQYGFVINKTSFSIDGTVGIKQLIVSVYPSTNCSGTPSASQTYPASNPMFIPKVGTIYNFSNAASYNFVISNSTAVGNMQSVQFLSYASTDQPFSTCFNGQFTNSSGNACTNDSCGFINNGDPNQLINSVNITLFSCIADPVAPSSICACLQQNDGSPNPLIWFVDSGAAISGGSVKMITTFLNGKGNNFNDKSSVGHCGYNTGWRVPTASDLTTNKYLNQVPANSTSDIGRLGNFATNNQINIYIPSTAGDKTLANWFGTNGVTDLSQYKYIQSGSTGGPQGFQPGGYEVSGPSSSNWFLNSTLGNYGRTGSLNSFLAVLSRP